NIVGHRVIAEFICHLRSKTKRLADASAGGTVRHRDGRTAGGAAGLCAQASAVRMIVSRSEWRGSQPRRARASAGSATSSGGSPGRRPASRNGTARPAIRSTAAITWRTHQPPAPGDPPAGGNPLPYRAALAGAKVHRAVLAARAEIAERAYVSVA